MSTTSECVTIFIGNPGSGKSTLLNSLAGLNIFQSGVSIGRGLTKNVLIARGSDGKLYGDTPGLDDVTMRALAADEIYKQLLANSVIKLCFVITLEAGRIKPADKATIEVVLDALPPSVNMYSIIVNKLEKSVANQLKNPEKLARLLFGLNSEKHYTPHVHFVMKESEVEGEDNVVLSNIQPLRNSLDSAPIFVYDPASVRPLQYDALEEMKEKFAGDLEKIKEANSAQLEELVAQHDEALARVRDDAQREREQFVQQMDPSNAEHLQIVSIFDERIVAANQFPIFFAILRRVVDAIEAILTHPPIDIGRIQ